MQRKNVIATLLGVACGDALGAPTEFMHRKSIKQRYGPEGVTDLTKLTGRYTDDTQMTIALAKGLLEAREHNPAEAMSDVEEVMPFVSKHFVAWSKSPDNNRSPGGSCMNGCSQLARGVPWKKSGTPGSQGCGTAMRVSPVGIVFEDIEDVIAVAKAQATCTHDSDTAREAAACAALGVNLLLRHSSDYDPFAAFEIACAVVEVPRFKALLGNVELAVKAVMEGGASPDEIMTHAHEHALGTSWKGDEAVASAWFCFLLAYVRNEGFVEAVRYGANTDGDSDSIACIAGSFAGAYWGLEGGRGIPRDWVEHVEDGHYLLGLGGDLCDLAEEIENL